MVRKYSTISVETTLASGINSSQTSMVVATGTGTTLMGGVVLTTGDTFAVAIDPETSSEEIVYITYVSGDALTYVRAQAGIYAISHTAGASVKHVLSSADLIYFNNAIQSTVAAPGTPTIDGGTP